MYIKIPPEADEQYVICTGRYFLLFYYPDHFVKYNEAK